MGFFAVRSSHAARSQPSFSARARGPRAVPNFYPWVAEARNGSEGRRENISQGGERPRNPAPPLPNPLAPLSIALLVPLPAAMLRLPGCLPPFSSSQAPSLSSCIAAILRASAGPAFRGAFLAVLDELEMEQGRRSCRSPLGGQWELAAALGRVGHSPMALARRHCKDGDEDDILRYGATDSSAFSPHIYPILYALSSSSPVMAGGPWPQHLPEFCPTTQTLALLFLGQKEVFGGAGSRSFSLDEWQGGSAGGEHDLALIQWIGN